MGEIGRERIEELLRENRHLFPEYGDLSRIDPERHRNLIMERLGGAGGTKEIRVLVEYYGRDEFLEVILRSRRVSERTRRFFKLVLRPSPPAATDQLVIL